MAWWWFDIIVTTTIRQHVFLIFLLLFHKRQKSLFFLKDPNLWNIMSKKRKKKECAIHSVCVFVSFRLVFIFIFVDVSHKNMCDNNNKTKHCKLFLIFIIIIVLMIEMMMWWKIGNFFSFSFSLWLVGIKKKNSTFSDSQSSSHMLFFNSYFWLIESSKKMILIQTRISYHQPMENLSPIHVKQSLIITMIILSF